MRKLMAVLGVVGLVALAGRAPAGDDDAAINEVKKLSKAYARATEAQDKKFYQQTLHDSFVRIALDGSKLDKKETMAADLGKDVSFESVRSSDVEVRVFGDTAVETGRLAIAGTFDGKKSRLTVAYTDVWVKDGGRWKLASEHLTQVKGGGR